MTTVKEFKGLGVEFVKGDERGSSAKGHGDVYMSEDMAYGSNHECKTDHELIVSFAWRPLSTLPDNPKFKYEIGGHMPQWRPLLDQSAPKPVNDAAVKPSDDKPVFTQAMADAGELPPVGSLFRIHKHNYIMVGLSSTGSVVGEHCEFAEYKGFHARDCKPIDTRTPKQKAVEHMIDIWARSDISGSEALFETIYDELIDKC